MNGAWPGEYLCRLQDLAKIEKADLGGMVRDGCAWMTKDTRRSLKALVVETLTDETIDQQVYVREYVIFLEGGLWWRVPTVKVRLVYNHRTNCGWLKMAPGDFESLYSAYFPQSHHSQNIVVEGLEPQLHKVKVTA